MTPGVLLLRLRIRRFLNRLQTLGARKARPGEGRRATPPKTRRGWALSLVFGALIFFSYLGVATQAIVNLEQALGTAKVEWTDVDAMEFGPRPSLDREALAQAPGMLVPEDFFRGASLVLGLLVVASLLVSIANREFSQPEWDLEWLVTLPIRLSTLVKIRILERTILNLFTLLAVLPFLVMLAVRSRPDAWGLGAAIGSALGLMILVGTLQTLIEVVLRLHVPPARRRNLQAVFSIIGLVLLYLAMSVGLGAGRDPEYFVYDIARRLPGWLEWLPAGLSIRSITSGSVPSVLGHLAAFGATVTVVLVATVVLLQRRLERGILSVGARESGRSRPRPALSTRQAPRWGVTSWLSPIQEKELRLLSRDRSFLVQTLVLPVVIGGLQIVINPGILSGAASTPSHLATFAFGITAYVLLFSAFQILNAEGKSLWLLYTVPHRLESIVAQKALLWGGLALIYPTVILGSALVLAPAASVAALPIFVVVFVGIPIYAMIAACLGVLGANPLDPDVQRRVRPRQAYLYMLLASLYTFSIYSHEVWQRSVLVFLTGLVAYALWQKTRDLLPYLLDPVATPPPVVSLADGLIAAQVFFVLQGMLALAFDAAGGVQGGVVVAYAIAGALTYLVFRWMFWRRKVQGVPELVARTWPGDLVVGLASSVPVALLGVAYAWLGPRIGLEIPRPEGEALRLFGDWMGLVVLGVVLAPFCEEFIFRGLVFGGLRRSLGFWPAALASAGVFAAVHPPISVIPVLFLGLAAAWAYERTHVLVAPIVVHAVYNAAQFAFVAWTS